MIPRTITLEPSPRPRRHSSASDRARAAALTLFIPILVLGGCWSKAGPRPATWARPVPSASLKNLYQVDTDVYRSEQPTREGFEEMRAKGIRTIINLRTDRLDETLVEGLGFELVEIPMRAWRVSEEDVVKALRAIQAAPKPVLVHCQFGSDRVGVIMAMYRIVFQGWTKTEALAELEGGGFGFHRYYLNIPAFVKSADVGRIREQLKIG